MSGLPAASGRAGRILRAALTIAVIFAVAAAGLWFLWNQISETEISPMGMWMLVGGAAITFALGAGLMALAFHSHKSGHDDRVDDRDRRQGGGTTE